MQNKANDIPDFSKSELIPAIVQDINTKAVLMLGYVNEDAFQATLSTSKVTFLVVQKIDCG